VLFPNRFIASTSCRLLLGSICCWAQTVSRLIGLAENSLKILKIW
jgi:hypothetical protein